MLNAPNLIHLEFFIAFENFNVEYGAACGQLVMKLSGGFWSEKFS